MPIPVKRDLSETRQVLQKWFDERRDTPHNAKVNEDLSTPSGAGNANETILFTLSFRDEGETHDQPLVLRIEATSFALFMEDSLADQCSLLDQLRGHVSFPIPNVRWFEERDTIMGAPFCIMDRAPGRVPPDDPSIANWTFQLNDEDRRRLWENAFTTFCSIHSDKDLKQITPYVAGVLKERGTITQQLDYWRRYREWSGLQDPRLERLHTWLSSHVPADSLLSLSWGDARIENMIFGEDLTCTAVLDWELASMGGPLMDLGWWLLFDRQMSKILGVARPEIMGADRQETLEMWRKLTGIPTESVYWYELFASYRLSAITSRWIALNTSWGVDLSLYGDLIGDILEVAGDVVS